MINNQRRHREQRDRYIHVVERMNFSCEYIRVWGNFLNNVVIRGEPIASPNFDSFHEIGTPVAQYGREYKEMFAQQRLIALSFCPL